MREKSMGLVNNRRGLNGSPTSGMPTAERFAFYCESQPRGFHEDCRIWKGHKTPNGYGTFKISDDGKQTTRIAHVWAWEQDNGPLPPGKQLDHLCSQRDCVRVDHLELVTPMQNVRRSRSAKLTTEQAVEIYLRRNLGERARGLACEYGVSTSTVYLIAKNGPYGPRLPEQNARHRAASYPSASTAARKRRAGG